MIEEQMGYKGYFQICMEDICTGEEYCGMRLAENLLTEINREYRQAMLDGTFLSKGYNIADLEIKYFALGDGTNPVALTDTTLQNEIIRRPITSVSSSGTDTTSITVFPADVANFRIREIGVFCGPAATGVANSGILISRINVDVTKTANIVMNVNRIDRTVI